MADKYCDHGAYSSTLGDTPTWGVPQEGDGSTLTPSSSASIASIQFNTVPTSGNMLVCGVTFTSPSGVLNAVNVGAAADAMASLINSSTSTVSSVVAIGTPQLRNLVYARGPSNGAPAGTCQLMMRVGSASLNYSNNTNVVISHTLNVAPTITQFAGGSGGCWGWFFNPVAIGVSNSIAVGTYGAMLAFPMVGTIPTKNDTVWVRTGGGASKVISTTVTSNTTFPHADFGTNYIFDTNTKWVSDSNSGTLRLYFQCTTWGTEHNLRSSFQYRPTSYVALRHGGFEFEFNGNTSTKFGIGPTVNSSEYRERWVNVVFRDSGTETSGNRALFSPFEVSSPGGAIQRLYENCAFIVTTARTTIWRKLFTSPYSTRAYFQFSGCKFDFNISGVADPGSLTDLNTYQSDCTYEFSACEFLGRSGGYKLTDSTTNWQTNGNRLVLIMDRCTGVQMSETYLGLPTPQLVMTRPDQHLIVQNNLTSNSLTGYRYEDCRGVLEWLPDSGIAFPTLTATVQGVGVPYSMRAIWLQMADLSPAYPFSPPAFKAFTQLPSASRTLTLQLLVPSSVTGGVSAQFSYLDNSGRLRSQVANNLVASSASWSGASLYPLYVAMKLEIVTDFQVAANSEISCCLSFNSSPPEVVTQVYIDPEIGVQ